MLIAFVVFHGTSSMWTPFHAVRAAVVEIGSDPGIDGHARRGRCVNLVDLGFGYYGRGRSWNAGACRRAATSADPRGYD